MRHGRTGTLHAWEQKASHLTSRPSRRVSAATRPSAPCWRPGRVGGALRDGSGPFQHGLPGTSYACAAALAVQQVIRDDGLLEQVQQRGALLERLLVEWLGSHRHVGAIRGRGLLLLMKPSPKKQNSLGADPIFHKTRGSLLRHHRLVRREWHDMRSVGKNLQAGR